MALSEFALELWIKYAVALPFMIVRFAARFYTHGWRNFDGTDLWCAMATALYTIVSSCDYVLSTPNYPTNIGLNEMTAMEVPDEKIPLMERGAKIAHFSWTMYICMIFSFKGVMLCLFKRVSMGIKNQERAVLYATVFVVLCWVASVLAHLCACVPVERVWQVKPYPGPLCTSRPQNYYVAGMLNLLTDAIIIIIPMPMLWKLKLPLRRKLALAGLFGSGIFVIICTSLRTYYVLGSKSDQFLAQMWASREAFVSMIVVSVPGIWSLFVKRGWLGHTHVSEYKKSSSTRSKSGSRWKSNGSQLDRSPTLVDDGYELEFRAEGERLGSADSEERIIVPEESDLPVDTNITVTKEYTVQFEHGVEDKEDIARSRGINWSSEA